MYLFATFHSKEKDSVYTERAQDTLGLKKKVREWYTSYDCISVKTKYLYIIYT